jgi:hypothetical protein
MNERLIENIRRRMKALGTEELIAVITVKREDYTPLALEIAEAELASRNTSPALVHAQFENQTLELREAERQAFSEELRVIDQLDNEGHTCHLCGAEATATVPFGLGIVTTVERDTDMLASSAIISAITLPFLGAGMLIANRSGEAELLVLHLRMCESCKRRRTTFFGNLDISGIDCMRHPGWERAQRLGFTYYVSPAALAKHEANGHPESM